MRLFFLISTPIMRMAGFTSFLLPHGFVFSYCLTMATLAVAMTNITTDQSGILALKYRITNDPQNLLATNWSSSTPVCSWIGITCSRRHGRVIAIELTHMRLTSTIPPEIGNLSFLGVLRLGNNSFHGSIPIELANLRRLKFISFSFNDFSGEIPPWLGSFTELQRLFLNGNYFTGSIPPSVCYIPKLVTLVLSANNLRGSIPEEIGNLPNLKELYLDRNQLSGVIPPTILNLSSLQMIDLSDNQLSGSIPPIIRNMSSLRLIDFAVNNLSGPVPADMFYHLPSLEEVYFTWNLFSGQIPPSLFHCQQLQTFSWSNNHFEGSISTDIRNLTMLKTLFLGLNRLTGTIPKQIGHLKSLEILSLTKNSLSGPITPVIGNLTQLKLLDLSFNNLTGSIPDEIGNLDHAEILHFSMNRIIGNIPTVIFNISTVQVISLAGNSLSGHLPSTTGLWLPSLQRLLLGGNKLTGTIPSSLSNASQLTIIDFDSNMFSGYIPDTLGNLRHLQRIQLGDNYLTSRYAELSFLTSLTNCKQLTQLRFEGNPLNGSLPVSIVNLSSSLQVFSAPECNIKGDIPRGIGNLVKLAEFDLGTNELTGVIPTSIGRMSILQLLSLEDNELQGSIPPELCHLERLAYLSLTGNELFGSIPECLGNLISLRSLSLGSNRFTSTIPLNVWRLGDVLHVNLSWNHLTGSLPLNAANLKVVREIDLSGNNLSGDIPPAIGDLKDLAYLSLSSNRFLGPIPPSFGELVSLEFLDLSNNSFSGVIPESLQELLYLNYFNVSFNALEGEIPTGGPFSNFSRQSFMGNEGLCGPPEMQLQACKPTTSRGSNKARKLVLTYILPASASATFISVLIIILVRCYKRNEKFPTEEDSLPFATWRRITYMELQQATDRFSENNLVGMGSYGCVYKGTISNGMNVAVKVFNSQLERAFKSFDTECEVLSNIRHRNLIKIISSCSNIDFKALVLRYMPNGNLEKWLYSDTHHFDILQRLNIMIDVASALEYLHHDYATPIVHCDLKPSNVLLDEDLVGHVGDFGIAKLLGEEDSVTQTMTLATIGYMAPEYGSEGIVSIRGDVYSFGIMLMETFTKKRPTDEMFAGEMSLKRWVKESLPHAIAQVADVDLLTNERENRTAKKDCLSSIMSLALDCSAELPEERMDITEARVALEKMKTKFLNDLTWD